MNIYVGNLSGDVTADDLKQAFAGFGQVESVNVIKDKYTGESRGFGFVEMASKKEAEAAINGVKQIKDRMVTVNEARPREDSRSGQRGGAGRDKRSGGFNQGRAGRY